MRGLPVSYVLRSLWVRKVTTLLTAASMALVVYVFAAVLMMSQGIRETLVATGSPGNLMLLRKGATAEINSAITRAQAATISTLAAIARDGAGRPMVSPESVVLNSLPRRRGGAPGSVSLRGTSERVLALRPQARLVQGRMFAAGTAEIVAGRAAARGFAHVDLGDTLHMAGRDWRVVGLLDGGGSGFDSELWADAEQVLQAFRREAYSSVVFALSDLRELDATRLALESDPRLGVEVQTEQAFYAQQSEQLVHFIRVLGLSLALTFSLGAVAGAMITMLAAVASRTAEIGTLRALGFRRGAVLWAFLGESLALSAVGGVVGVLCAASMSSLDVSTTNFQTFSEMSFRFEMTPSITVASLLFSLAMGLLGGFVPAWRAARLGIVDSLRAR